MDAPTIYQGLVQRGFKPAQAAMLAGNMQQESGFNPQAWNAKEGAGGLLQWRKDRLQNLLQFAKTQGKAPGDVNTQLDFLTHEIQTTEGKAGKAFLAAQDPASMNAALKGYIRYGDNSQGTRLQNGLGIFKTLGAAQPAANKAVITPAGTGATGSQTVDNSDIESFINSKLSDKPAEAAPAATAAPDNTGAPGQITEQPIPLPKDSPQWAQQGNVAQPAAAGADTSIDDFIASKLGDKAAGEAAQPQATLGSAANTTEVAKTAPSPAQGQEMAAAAPAPEPQTPNIAEKGDLGALDPNGAGAPGHLMAPGSASAWQGATFGAGDEGMSGLAAGINTGINKLTGQGTQNLADNYGDAKATMDAQLAWEREHMPKTAAGLEIAGAIAPAIMTAGGSMAAEAPAAAGPLARAGAIATKTGKNMLVGGGLGAASGFASGNGLEDRLQKAHDSALTGMVAGAVAPAALAAGAKTAQVAKDFFKAFDPFLGSFGEKRIAQRIAQNAVGGKDVAAQAGELVPGSIPTAAETSGSANVATLQRQVQSANPELFADRAAGNNQARLDFLTNLAGQPSDLAAAKDALSTATDQQVKQLFKPGQVADTSSIVQKIDSILGGTSGQGDAVKGVMQKLRSKLVDSNGNPISMDPQTLYDSLRKQDIAMALSDSTTSGKDAAKFATGPLKQVQGALDDAIEQAAPGFKSYMAGQADARQKLGAMEYLQKLDLVNPDGTVTLGKVDSALKTIVKQRAAKGVNDAKSLTDDQLQKLVDLHSDLARANNIKLGLPPNSATVQNLTATDALQNALPFGVGKMVSRLNPETVGTGAGGALGYLSTGGSATGAGVGAFVGKQAGKAVGAFMQKKNAKVMDEVQNLLLHPANIKKGRQNLPINRLTNPAIAAGVTIANRRNMLLPSNQ